MRIQVIICFILLFTYFQGISQDDTITKNPLAINYYAAIGGGSFISKSSWLVAWRASLNVNLNNKYTLQGLHQESDLLGPDLKGSAESKGNHMLSVKTWMILLGINKQYNKVLSLNASAGVSFGSYRYKGKYLYSIDGNGGFFNTKQAIYEYENKTYIGLPINLELKLTTKRIGFGVSLFGNFYKHSEGGFLVSVLIGKIR